MEPVDELLWWQTKPETPPPGPPRRPYDWQCLVCGTLLAAVWLSEAEIARFTLLPATRPRCSRGHGPMWLDVSVQRSRSG